VLCASTSGLRGDINELLLYLKNKKKTIKIQTRIF